MNNKVWVGVFILLIILLQLFFYFSGGRGASNRPIFIDSNNFEVAHHEFEVCEENADVVELKERIVRLEMEKKELTIENRELQANCGDDTPKVWKQSFGHEKVAFVSYPSSGGLGIQQLISKISNLTVFSVYPSSNLIREEDAMGANLDLYSDCYAHHCTLPEGAPILMRTYYPTVTLQSKLPAIEKIIRVVRNPADNIYSFFNTAKESKFFASRIRAWNSHVEYESNELKKFTDFWERYTRDLYISTLVIRYEDFCVNPVGVMSEILKFLGLDYDQNELTKYTLGFQCDPKDHIGHSFSQYTKEQLTKLTTRFSEFNEKYDYSLLFRDV